MSNYSPQRKRLRTNKCKLHQPDNGHHITTNNNSTAHPTDSATALPWYSDAAELASLDGPLVGDSTADESENGEDVESDDDVTEGEGGWDDEEEAEEEAEAEDSLEALVDPMED